MAEAEGNQRLRERREAAGLSQEGLARRSECSLNTVGRIERGRGRPSLDVALRIASVLGADARDLFGPV